MNYALVNYILDKNFALLYNFFIYGYDEEK